MVLYFYPKDETPICTKEACTFRNEFDTFKQFNCTVVGISADSPQSHKAFIKNHQLPFILLSDKDNKVRKKLGVPRDFLGLLTGRYTYVINREGLVVEVISGALIADVHIQKSLKKLAHEQRTHP